MGEVHGDHKVLRTGYHQRRSNQGLKELQVLDAELVTDKDQEWWNVLETDGNGAQDFKLPDATTLKFNEDGITFDQAWQVVVDNVGTVDSINVKTNDGTLLKEVAVGRAYAFTLRNNDDVPGSWHINFLEQHDDLVVSRFVATFNNTSSWSGPAGGYYSQQYLAATHGRGSDPVVQISRLYSGSYIKVRMDKWWVDGSDNINFRAPELPDLRFAGKIVAL